MRALDQSGNISEYECAAVDFDHSELRVKRCERIFGKLWLGGADRREQRGFAGIWQAHNASVRDQLQAQADRELFARLAGIGAPGRAIGRALEMRIAEAAVAAAR